MNTEETRVSIFLRFKWSKDIKFNVACKLCCLHSAREEHSFVLTRKIAKEELKQGVDYGWPTFIEQEKLFDPKNMIVDKLLFSCEVCFTW